ncbi:MAG TPA: universal stress protein [Burkholderiales bacterium]|jgi:nucleotide-binding universal stress UspA family protein
MYKNILLPTDGSALSRAAVLNGIRLARAVGARVTGFFAAPPATPVVYRGVLPVGLATPEMHARAIERTAGRYLRFIEKAARRAGVRCRCVHVTSDFPADAIMAAARKEGCDLIVMASRSKRGFSGMLLGSQTHKVLAHSKVPVLVQR